MLTQRYAVWMVVGALGISGSVIGCSGDDTEESSGTTTTATTTTTTSTTSTTTTSTTTTTTTTGAAATCADYCAGVMGACTAANQQYNEEATCLTVCETWDQGDPGATMGNSIECHAYHAGAAESGADMHCPHAGPAGGGPCGDLRTNFCELVDVVCPGVYTDCANEIMGLDDTETYDASDTAGDTLACRMYHLTVASTSADAATTHCPHTGVDSGPCN